MDTVYPAESHNDNLWYVKVVVIIFLRWNFYVKHCVKLLSIFPRNNYVQGVSFFGEKLNYCQ